MGGHSGRGPRRPHCGSPALLGDPAEALPSWETPRTGGWAGGCAGGWPPHSAASVTLNSINFNSTLRLHDTHLSSALCQAPGTQWGPADSVPLNRGGMCPVGHTKTGPPFLPVSFCPAPALMNHVIISSQSKQNVKKALPVFLLPEQLLHSLQCLVRVSRPLQTLRPSPPLSSGK